MTYRGELLLVLLVGIASVVAEETSTAEELPKDVAEARGRRKFYKFLFKACKTTQSDSRRDFIWFCPNFSSDPDDLIAVHRAADQDQNRPGGSFFSWNLLLWGKNLARGLLWALDRIWCATAVSVGWNHRISRLGTGVHLQLSGTGTVVQRIVLGSILGFVPGLVLWIVPGTFILTRWCFCCFSSQQCLPSTHGIKSRGSWNETTRKTVRGWWGIAGKRVKLSISFK